MGEKYLKTKDGSIEDVVKQMQNKVLESDYQDKFKKELDNAGKPLGHMTGMEKKEFYSKVDGQEIKEEKEMNEARWMVSGTMGYKGIGGVDGFEMVINANSEQDAIRRAEKELDRARSRRSIGPGGGGNLEDVDIEGAERTNEPLQKPYSYMLNHNDPSKDKEEIKERDGANTSSRKGSVWKKAKKWRFGMKVGEHDPSKDKEEVKEGFFDTKTFAQMVEDIKSKKKSPEKTAKVEPTSSKDSKEAPGKDADQLEKQLVVAQGQINLLKQKIENEKNKVVKPEPNKETGEVPLTIGIAHKLLKDKDEKKKEEVKETHMGQTAKANRHQRSAGGEKEVIKTPKNEWKTFAMMAAEIKEGKGSKEDKKKEQQADTDTRDQKKKTMTGQVATSPEMNPRVDYKY
tara:strand:+ start:3634 stop:4836 length:1203 start_codon:yes stop_codon:yes gene_type:complete